MARNGLLAEAHLLQRRCPNPYLPHCLKENIEEFKDKDRIILSLEKLKIAFFHETNV
jgi:hypothetical protein